MCILYVKYVKRYKYGLLSRFRITVFILHKCALFNLSVLLPQCWMRISPIIKLNNTVDKGWKLGRGAQASFGWGQPIAYSVAQ